MGPSAIEHLYYYDSTERGDRQPERSTREERKSPVHGTGLAVVDGSVYNGDTTGKGGMIWTGGMTG